MAAVGKQEENADAERLMRTIKEEEEVDLSEYEDLADARRQLGRFLDDVYNTKRIHSSLRYLTPVDGLEQARLTAGILSMHFDRSARGPVSPELPASRDAKVPVNPIRALRR
jgi:hypothetical protein